MKTKQYTIKAISDEGVYYLVCGWNKYKTYWVSQDDLKSEMIFTTIRAAKTSLNKLLKVMSDYLCDRFVLVSIDGDTITELKNLKISTFKTGSNYFYDRYDVMIEEETI